MNKQDNVVRILTLLLAIGSACGAIAQVNPSGQKRLIGYYTSWSKYNNPPYTYSADQISYEKLTHIAHAFVLLDKNADGTLKVPQGYVEPALIAKAHAAGVKVLVSVGGGDGIQGPRFNRMARVAAYRRAFVRNVHAFLEANGYDGVDIDWEVPNANDMSNCTTLMQELRNELPAGQWLVSMATPSDPRNWGQGFDIPALTPLVDFFNVMTYDFTGPWSATAGLNSPLRQDPADPEQAGSVKTSMNLYRNTYGVAAGQLNIGTPFYGYEFAGASGLWAACGGCVDSYLNYGSDIKPLIGQQGWLRHMDKEAQAPYLLNPSLPGFITYDDPASTARKVRYVLNQRGFGGVFMWDLSADYDGKSEDLLDAMWRVWKTAQ